MRGHAEEIFTFRDIDLEFNSPSTGGELKLSVGLRRDLLLIFKEAVNNAARHSGCTKVWIDFHCEDSMLRLCIRDNGTGFEAGSVKDGQGLRSMSRRATAHGGKLNIDSQVGKETVVQFELPLLRGNKF